jgi:hypothetical protein
MSARLKGWKISASAASPSPMIEYSGAVW